MDWKEFISKDRDGLFIVYELDEIWIGRLYYCQHQNQIVPHGKVFNWGSYYGDDPECVDDEDMDNFKMSSFFEISKNSELFKEINSYLEIECEPKHPATE